MTASNPFTLQKVPRRARKERKSAAIQKLNPIRRYTVPRWKRWLDVGTILIAAPTVAPAMAVIAVLIKLASPGPLLFRQRRIGLNGVAFECLKFRTMHEGSPTNVHEQHLAELIHSNRPMAKLDGHDPRLIPCARLLRATGLDELPQLFNVLRGEMSLVGPRPCTPNEYDAYSATQRNRTGVLPGLTGLWQVSGKNNTTFSEMIALDLRYQHAHCLWLDLAILMRTPLVLLLEAARAIRRSKAAGNATNPSEHATSVPRPTRSTAAPLGLPWRKQSNASFASSNLNSRT